METQENTKDTELISSDSESNDFEHASDTNSEYMNSFMDRDLESSLISQMSNKTTSNYDTHNGLDDDVFRKIQEKMRQIQQKEMNASNDENNSCINQSNPDKKKSEEKHRMQFELKSQMKNVEKMIKDKKKNKDEENLKAK